MPEEQKEIAELPSVFAQRLQSRIQEKEAELQVLCLQADSNGCNAEEKELLAKAVLSLQNNWSVGEGELKHSGLFPSYHYQWFHGFWAWDSWKHAAALAGYAPTLAKEQILAMSDYQDNSGFIPDCIYRDTSIEAHNYRNTKPPLAAWAVWRIYQKDQDTGFLQLMVPKIMKQHLWWYTHRDHDRDGLCEYGSTDGTLVDDKWESGMDNAVRFDDSKIMKNSEAAYSLDQESVDLNAYLFAEKNYLIKMEEVLHHNDEADRLRADAQILKMKITEQFFETVSGWFYDTSLDGKILSRPWAAKAGFRCGLMPLLPHKLLLWLQT